MGRNVLYLAESAETSDGWQRRLREQGFEVLRTTDREQLALYARSHSAVGIILDASMNRNSSDELVGLVTRLRGEPTTADLPIIAMFAGIEAFGHVSVLAEAGISGFYLRGMPETLLLQYLHSGLALQNMKSLDESGMTVQKLANETRQKIHDLSQPLAALQGRLQILQSKTAPDDPQKVKIDLMVKLTFEIGTHLRDLQEFHRQFS